MKFNETTINTRPLCETDPREYHILCCVYENPSSADDDGFDELARQFSMSRQEQDRFFRSAFEHWKGISLAGLTTNFPNDYSDDGK